ncbi:MAG TPA: NAD(P)/FAD-dependent oxidoreductase [Gaiellaceae bacterium]|nr:NAD(P)/FAD-dependent oxidoreductase [Gaiellaceae bacterium]
MIVVIGAGPAGLASAAMLRRAGAEVVVLDRGGVGDAWTKRYDRLHLHTVRWLSCLPGYRMPRDFGKWPTHARVLEYLQRYAEHHRLDVRTGVEAWRVVRGESGWVVETPDGEFAAERVVVATGFSSVPFIPDWPGEFAGEIVHSADYRNPAPYVGRRVLVVGAGNSGAEIAADLAEGGAAEVSIAVRTPPSIVRRDTLGVPSQLFGIASSHLPVGVVDQVAATMRRVSIPDLTAEGLPAPERPYSDFLRRRVIPIIDVGLVAGVRSGRIRVVPALERLDGGRVVLADGSSVEVDAIVAATGFRTGLEPLVGHLGVLDERGEPVVHGPEEHPEARGLNFVGFRLTLGGTFRLVGSQAQQLGHAYTGSDYGSTVLT